MGKRRVRLIAQIRNYSTPRCHLFKFSLENSRKRAIKQPGPPPTTTLSPSRARAARWHDENEQARRKKSRRNSISSGRQSRRVKVNGPEIKVAEAILHASTPSSFSVPFVPTNGTLITPLSMSNAGQFAPESILTSRQIIISDSPPKRKRKLRGIGSTNDPRFICSTRNWGKKVN